MKLKTLLLLAALFFTLSENSFAQDEINRAEFFGGFSHNRVDTGFDEDEDLDDVFDSSTGMNGFNLSVTGNFSKYVGAKFDFAHHRKSESDSLTGGAFETRYRMNTFMGGVQFKNNKKDGPRVKPFGHILAGVARQSVRFTTTDDDFDFSDFSTGQNNFTLAVGGGLDVRVSRRVDIRVFQIDYNPVFERDFDIDGTTFSGQTQHNFRFGFGVVIH